MVAWRLEGVKADIATAPGLAEQDGALTASRAEAITGAMLIYKIFRSDEWAALRRDGQTVGAPIDVADGYVHFSTAEQAAETAAKHFAGAEVLYLLAVETNTLGDALFPHLYRELRISDVLWAQPLPLKDGVHQFPPGLSEISE